jgi:lysophospholipase L1-like esterase
VSRSALWREWLEIVALVAGGLLVGLGLLELIARGLWEDGWQDPTQHAALLEQGLPVYETVLELAQANSRGIHRNVFHRTNSLGIRGPEYEARAPEGVFRIAVTGDSLTMGAGVAEKDRYTDQLARRLGGGYEVLNVGLSGLNAGGAVDRLAVLSRSYRSHLLVYGFTLNDIESGAYRTRGEAVPPKDFGRIYWSAVAEVERQPFYFRRFLLAWQFERNKPTGGDAEVLENYLDNPAAWAEFAAGLDRFASLARTRGVCGHVLIHTHLGQLDQRHPYLEVYDRVERAAIERGLSVGQSFPYFEALESKRARALWVSLFDPHPNREAHALLADALQDDLKRLPRECWERV